MAGEHDGQIEDGTGLLPDFKHESWIWLKRDDAPQGASGLVEGLCTSGYDLPGWRKFKAWRRQLKACERAASQIVYRGGPNKEARVKSAVRAYLAVGRELSAKVRESLLVLCDQAVCATGWERLAYFHAK